MSEPGSQKSVNPLSLDSRRVLVTGAASGIGRATCRLLSGLDARIVAVDLDELGLETLMRELPGQGHMRLGVDLADLERIPGWMSELANAGGPLSGVVHAAGLSCVQPLRLLTPAVYRNVLAVNTEAALALVRGFHKKSVRDPRGGSIVFVSSIMACAGAPGAAAYALTKSALHGLTRSLAIELAPAKVRVNCVAPGFVQTPMFDRMASLWEEEQRASVEAAHPLGLGSPLDVAHGVAFLLADTARWITGTVLTVDGGYTAH
jgi:NAD(P)-dependent dehydrogenase (short-subunit alcohol dehydrogenase family)